LQVLLPARRFLFIGTDDALVTNQEIARRVQPEPIRRVTMSTAGRLSHRRHSGREDLGEWNPPGNALAVESGTLRRPAHIAACSEGL